MVDTVSKMIPEASKQAVMKQTRQGAAGTGGGQGRHGAVVVDGEGAWGMKMKTDKRMKKH